MRLILIINIFFNKVRAHLKSGLLFFVFSAFLLRVAVVAASLIISRKLDVENFGRYSAIYFMVQAVAVIFSFGLPITATKYISYFNSISSVKMLEIQALIIKTYVILTLIILPFFVIYKTHALDIFFKGEITSLAYLFIIASVVGCSLNMIQMGIMAGYKDYYGMALNNIILAVSYVLIILPSVINFGIIGACVGFFLMYFIPCLNGVIKNKTRKISVIYDKNSVTDFKNILLNFTIPAFFAAVLVLPTMWICQLILMQGSDGLRQTAIYGVSLQWYNAVLFFPGIVAGLAMPKMTGLNIKMRRNLLLKALKLNIVTSIAGAILVILSWNWIKNKYGDIFDLRSDMALYLMVCASVINSVSTLIGQVLVSASKMWLGYFVNVIWALLMIVLTYIFTSSGLGAFGVAISFLVAYASHLIIQLFLVKKINILV